MSCLLHLQHDGWDVLTSAWSAASGNNWSTNIVYSWGYTGSSTAPVARASLDIPFKTFFNYIAACEKNNEIADLTEKNLPRIISEYTNNRD